MSLSDWAATAFYLVGAYQYWVSCRQSELIATLYTKQDIRMVPHEKSIACALWPVVVVALLIGSFFYTPDEDIDERR